MNYHQVNDLNLNNSPKILTNSMQDEHAKLYMPYPTYPENFDSTHTSNRHESNLSSIGMDSNESEDAHTHNKLLCLDPTSKPKIYTGCDDERV
jgi:hypothetical protein